jgi:Putative porin
MKYFIIIFFFTASLFAQEIDGLNDVKKDTIRKSLRDKPKENPKAPINQYQIITLERDTTYVDTSLTIQKDYKFNYLRRDNFGLLAFANDGQTYNTLNFGLKQNSTLPLFGFKAKHFNYKSTNEVNYYNVATPITDLYFRTVLEQGQAVNAFITLNTSKRFNFSLDYRGLRSLGKYLNSLSSSGNFVFTTSFSSTNKKYFANFHYANQDILNGENGGLLNLTDFSSGNSQFLQRSRLDIQLATAKSILTGKRYFLDHTYHILNRADYNLSVNQQISYESKFFEFSSAAAITKFGSTYSAGNYFDVTKNNILQNKIETNLEHKSLGGFSFFIDNYNYNYFYNRVILSNNSVLVPNSNNQNLNDFGLKYKYNKSKLKGEATLIKSLSQQNFSMLDVAASYNFDIKNNVSARFTNQNKVPDLNYTLFQSSFVSYNWFNSFKNEKINALSLQANTQFGNAEADVKSLNNHLYFSNNDILGTKTFVTPKQYGQTINYISLKVSKEFKFRKFALDNTILYQKVSQPDNIINVPTILTRNTLYFSDYVFKKAMLLQTGVTFQGFTKYYANEYNPVIGEFYVQDAAKIGNFPLVDIFVNARVRQARIFLKAEHVNASFTGRNYLSSPNTPYKDFLIRFGIVWTFFQ